MYSEPVFASLPDSTINNYRASNQISLSDSLVNYGKLFLRTPYHYGSPGTSSFDCSGFTSYVYRNFGYNLDRSSREQANQFEPVDRSNLKVGDLVFFSGRHRSKQVGHVGIVVAAKGNGEFNFIHAAVHSGVTISSSTEAYYTKRFLKASRVIVANPILTIFHNLSKSFKSESETPKPKQTFVANYAKIQPSEPAQQTKKVIPAEYHRVKSGETLSSIAQKYGMTITELKRKNNITSNKLRLKQRLKVKDEETIVEDAKTTINNSSNLADNKTTLNKTETSNKQQNTSHVVKKGETLFSISKLYNTSVDELKKINNIPKGKIHPGQELKINQEAEPAKTTEMAKVEKPQKTTKHKVISGESLYSISKLYNIPVAELEKINNIPNAKIKPGQELKLTQDVEPKTKDIIADKSDKQQNNKSEISEKGIKHKVKKGETLITIAKNNNISVDELMKINNLTDSKIQLGQKLKLTQSDEPKSTSTKPDSKPVTIQHKVRSGESYYTIAKKYGCTVDDLKKWNNKTGNKVKIGEKVIVFAKN
ncbi:MAG: LysM peptidoglycan-binding domain-containing protein [Paludibacter sp.]|nr:LysM peptidoglycan-binding domain-containing protein [Paludibacter sp.]